MIKKNFYIHLVFIFLAYGIFLLKFNIEIANAANNENENLMPIVADINIYDIEVNSNFIGTNLIIFGAKSDFNDIIVSISGPNKKYLIAKREKLFGLWLKKKVVTLNEVPSYYSHWISKNLKSQENALNFYDFGLENLNYEMDDKYDMSYDEKKRFKEAFILYMKKKNLYHELSYIKNSNNNLFKIETFIPDNASIGDYLINLKSLTNNDLFKLEGEVIMGLKVKHLNVNKFFNKLNNFYSKTYAFLLVIMAFFNILIIKFLMKRY